MDDRLKTILGDFFAREQTEPRRLFHGRGQCFPGLESLCIDWFPPIVLVSAFAPLSRIDTFVEALIACDAVGQIESVLLQHRHVEQSPCECVYGKDLREAVVCEDGLQFEVHPGRRQNAGLFLDTRPLRQWLRANSADCSVLNLFAYTCSLSVAALAGGARSVTNVDVSRPAIAWGERNHRLNGQGGDRVRSVPHNLFTSWNRIHKLGPYDLAIVDPPSRQRGSFDARRDYGRVLKRLVKVCRPGARVVAALNSPFLDFDFLLRQCEKALPGYILVERLEPAPEFVEAEPDKGLKLCVLELPHRDG